MASAAKPNQNPNISSVLLNLHPQNKTLRKGASQNGQRPNFNVDIEHLSALKVALANWRNRFFSFFDLQKINFFKLARFGLKKRRSCSENVFNLNGLRSF
jgi:hypothetical protein